jgi:hypothetical protein
MACQFEHHYVVVNGTNQPITVEYHFRPFPDGGHVNRYGVLVSTYYFHEPKLKRLSEIEKDSPAWQFTLERRTIRDDATGGLKITLLPGEALQVFSDDGLAAYENDHPTEQRSKYPIFPIADLTISGNKGQVTYKDDLVIKQFSKSESFVYQLRYE